MLSHYDANVIILADAIQYRLSVIKTQVAPGCRLICLEFSPLSIIFIIIIHIAQTSVPSTSLVICSLSVYPSRYHPGSPANIRDFCHFKNLQLSLRAKENTKSQIEERTNCYSNQYITQTFRIAALAHVDSCPVTNQAIANSHKATSQSKYCIDMPILTILKTLKKPAAAKR